MENLLIFLGKASLLLILFYLSYQLLLKQESSFSLNRKFLLAGLLTSVILPNLYFTKKVFVAAQTLSLAPANLANYAITQTPAPQTDWWEIAGFCYLIVTGIFLLRLCLQLASLFKIIAGHSFEKIGRYNFITTSRYSLPISFFNFIIYNPAQHRLDELKLILEHEKVHARQFHSADILMANLFQAFFWFNPIIWLYKRSIEENLEFIADQETVSLFGEKKKYQQTLVKVSFSDARPALTNNFYQSFIKKRIIMLNKKSNKKDQAWKVGLVLPLLFAFMLVFNVKTEAQVVKAKEVEKTGTGFVEKSETSITIAKTSKPESLKKFSEIFKKQNVILQFNNIRRNSKGFITNIEVTFEDEELGSKGNLIRNDSDGIESFTFYKNTNGEIGFREANAFATKNMINGNGGIISQIGASPLYIINGKEYTTQQLQNKTIGFDGAVEGYAPQEALEQYGKKAGDGVIIIKKGKIIDDFSAELKKIDFENKAVTRSYLEINPDYEKPVLIKLENNEDKNKRNLKKRKKENNSSSIDKSAKEKKFVVSAAVSSVSFSTSDKREIKNELNRLKNKGEDIIAVQNNSSYKFNHSDTEKPLFVINGEVMYSAYNPQNLSSENIRSINILNGAAGLNEYGQKAEHGVVEIYIKDFKGDTSPNTESAFWYITAGNTNEALTNIKNSIKAKKGIDLKYSNLKRNEGNRIISISITAQTKNGNKASTSFSNTAGIPSIFVGLDKDGRIVLSSNQLDASTTN